MPVHVFFVMQDYVLVFYQDAENTEASSADNQAAKGQATGTTDDYETHGGDEDEDDDDDDDNFNYEDDDDVDEGLQQAIENSILCRVLRDHEYSG